MSAGYVSLAAQLRGFRLRLGPTTLIFGAAIAVTLLLTVYPLLRLFAASVQSRAGTLSLEHYQAAFGRSFVVESVLNTFYLSVASTALAVFLGTLLAWIVTRTDTPWRSAFELVGAVPFIFPPLIGALAWVALGNPTTGLFNVLLKPTGLSLNVFSMPGLVWVVSLFTTPYVFLLTAGALKAVNPEMEEAARVSRSGVVRTLLRVTLPLAAPGILSGALLAFMHAASMFSVHAIIGRQANIYVLTTAIFRVVGGFPPNLYQGAALASTLLAIVTLGVYLQTRVMGRRGYATVAGKSFRPRVIQLGRWRYVTLGLALLYTTLVVLLPVGVLVLLSLQPYMAGLSATNLSLSSYSYVLFQYEPTRRAITNSLLLALGGATLGVGIAAVISYIIVRSQVRGRGLLNFLGMLPLGAPGVVMGVALLWAYMSPPFQLYGTLWILLVAYITKDLPVGIRAGTAAIAQVHRELDESARVCRASWGRMFVRILLPLLKPQLAAAWVLMFVSMLREVNASVLLYSAGNEVMAVAMFDLWEAGRMPQVAALAITSMVLAGLVTFAAQRLGNFKLSEMR